MTWLLPLLLIAACLAGAAMPPLLAARFVRYVREYEGTPPTAVGPLPKTTAILPCKGVDPGFAENLDTVFGQDHPDHELVFATATADDEACPVIRAAMARHPGVRARLVHAGLPERCSQQNNNQLAAAAAARPESEVLVVMDSDIRLRPDYLSRLVAPLRAGGDPGVMAATGYRWYSPVRGGLGSWLRSVWNGGALPFLPDPKRNFAWGGSMAFRRRDFDDATLRSLWGSTLSDDHTLSQHLRARGGRIEFVPACIAVSYEDSSLRETVAWTTRQTLVTRVYNPPFWTGVLLVHGLQNVATLAGIVLLAARAPGRVGTAWGIAGAALLLPLLGMCAGTLRMLAPVTAILPEGPAAQVRRNAWRYVALTPAASLLCLWNSLASRLTSEMTWRGVTYRMVSPRETVVVRGK